MLRRRKNQTRQEYEMGNMRSIFPGFKLQTRTRGQPTLASTIWNLPALRVSTISDRNLRRESEDLATLRHAGPVLSVGYTDIELTLAKAFTVKLPYLVSKVITMMDKRRGLEAR